MIECLNGHSTTFHLSTRAETTHEQKTKFKPAQLPGSYEDALS